MSLQAVRTAGASASGLTAGADVAHWVWCSNPGCDTAFDPQGTGRTVCWNCRQRTQVSVPRACVDCRRVFNPERASHAACPGCRLRREIEARDTFTPRQTIACATCMHGKAESRSDNGYICEASLARTCVPWIFARHHAPREG